MALVARLLSMWGLQDRAGVFRLSPSDIAAGKATTPTSDAAAAGPQRLAQRDPDGLTIRSCHDTSATTRVVYRGITPDLVARARGGAEGRSTPTPFRCRTFSPSMTSVTCLRRWRTGDRRTGLLPVAAAAVPPAAGAGLRLVVSRPRNKAVRLSPLRSGSCLVRVRRA